MEEPHFFERPDPTDFEPPPDMAAADDRTALVILTAERDALLARVEEQDKAIEMAFAQVRMVVERHRALAECVIKMLPLLVTGPAVMEGR